MNDLLFYALLIALIYYFFFYLPTQKKLNANQPLKHNRATQTEELEMNDDSQELARLKQDNQQKERTIIGLNQSYEKLETTKQKELLATEKNIDNLLKGIQELSKELE